MQVFSKKIIEWYNNNKRNLPWRITQDPYKIWLSEIILQQTRVAQGLPYYNRFVENYPTIKDFASADLSSILRLWQGLGYYSRARNMYATAQIIMNEYGGEFPKTYNELLKLKGIGSYTAAAIASFAYQEPVAAIDGNVYRVLARLFGIETDIGSSQAKKVFGGFADAIIDKNQPDVFNQAMMEFGAMQCTPSNPNCMFCPLSLECHANSTKTQHLLPVKLKKVKVKNRYFNYFIIESDNHFLLKERDSSDIWAGLYDYYLVESAEPVNDIEAISDAFLEQILAQNPHIDFSNEITHQLTHQKLHVKFWHLRLKSTLEALPLGYAFYSSTQIEELPKPILIENFIKKMVLH